MKNYLLIAALVMCFMSLQAQEYYTPSNANFTMDTLNNNDTITYTFPTSAAKETKNDWITWEIAVTNVADTCEVTIINEQSLGGVVWTAKDTIVASASSVGSNVLGYMKTIWQQGRHSRLRIYGAGTSSKAQIRVWAEKIKIPYLVSNISLP